MPGPDIAIAASAREWPDRLHRYVLDHGGARIVGRLMGATQCVDTSYDVIFIDDICSFLTPRLVSILRQQGQIVVGVFDAGDAPDAKRRLLECGISDVMESGAGAHEFLELAAAATVETADVQTPARGRSIGARSVGVLGVTDGVGATEVAVTIAAFASRRARVTLVDLDPSWPSVAQRLDLSPHPNLRTLVDVTLHGGDVDSALNVFGSLRVAGGSAWQRSVNPIPHHEVTMVLGSLAEQSDVLVADLGSEDRVPDIVVGGFDAVLVVAAADPVGLARLQKLRDRIVRIGDRSHVLLVVNKTPRRRFYRAELRAEAASTMAGFPIALLPFDDRLGPAVWEGKPSLKGPFGREVQRVANLVAGAR